MDKIKDLFSLNNILTIGILTWVASKVSTVSLFLFRSIIRKYLMSIYTSKASHRINLTNALKEVTIYPKYKDMIERNVNTDSVNPSLGFGIFIIKVRPFLWAYIYSWRETSVGHYNGYVHNIHVDLYGFGRKEVYDKLISKVYEEPEYEYVTTYNGFRGNTETYSVSTANKKLFGESHLTIENIVRDWYNSRDVYVNYYKKFKLSILLHGIPGTGKSSMIHRLYKLVGAKSLIVINNISMLDCNEVSHGSLAGEFVDVERNNNGVVVYLLEDVEKLLSVSEVYHDGVKNYAYSDPSLHKLMQFLDGINTPDNALIVLTTNFTEMLPEQLIRSGRIDVNLEMKPLTLLDVEAMCNHYGVDCSDILTQINSIEYKDDKEELVYKHRYRPSDVDNAIFNELIVQNRRKLNANK